MQEATHLAATVDPCLSGGGEMGVWMRALDWSQTPVGPVAGWPRSLKTTIQLALNSRYPMFIWWGSRLVHFYNDGYIPVLGRRHPWALGRSAPEVWREIWADVGPLAETVMKEGQATWNEQLMLFMERNGYAEETYFTFSYSPVPDDEGGVGGVFCACTEDTERVLGERRLRTLRQLSAGTADAKTAEAACELAIRCLAEHPADVSFALIYLRDLDGEAARLAGAAGLVPGGELAPARLDLRAGGEADGTAALWPFREALAGRSTVLRDLAGRARLPGGRWPEPTHTAMVLPLAIGQEQPTGFLVAGASPRRAFDDGYQGYFELLAGSIASAVANARAYEEERRRAEALAELDRAKTAFFSNVSHEFRTPLTLMLGPLEDLLAQPPAMGEEARGQLALVYRNGLRLLKLVNTLLDFSRIEAGRVQAVYEPTDLAALTADLASVFRSALERSGLALRIDCPTLPWPVHVDRDMWEKVVLNLLSNAFKFTLEGEIEVALSAEGDRAVLAVRDTGIGIAEHEIGDVFRRFHRVEGAQGRTHEGTGIGLALVQELVRLHGGTVAAASEPGRGSTFTVTIPSGTAHLPADRIGGARSLASTALGAAPFIEEALRWLPEEGPAASLRPPEEASHAAVSSLGPGAAAGSRPVVLLADDNADMREYLRRLLAERYEVEAAADGAAALARIAARRPDLVLADVMMPVLDGFGLLAAIRGDAALRDLPVILLSARAGEESRVEGLEAGADDYLTKPFSARELLARVGAHLTMQRVRREARRQVESAAEELRRARDEAEAAGRAKDAFLAMLSHELRSPLTPVLLTLPLLEGHPRLPADARADLATIRRSVELEARLIDDLLDLTRVAQGKLQFHFETVDVHALLRHACGISLADGKVRARLDLAARQPLVRADPARLQQVFWNLLNNAHKFTPAGGQVTIATSNLDGRLRIEVRDTGEGIEAELLPRIFDAFEQGGPGMTRRFGGLGLGLAISRTIAEAMGGTLAAGSEGPGRGATFRLEMPVAAEPAAKRAAEGAGEPETERPLRILVVEDDPATLEVMPRLLAVLGHEVRAAADVASALASAQAEAFDLVISDLGLPDGTGFDLMRALRERHGLTGIALSGFGMDEDVARSLEAGFCGHLTKPVDVERLKAMIRHAARQVS